MTTTRTKTGRQSTQTTGEGSGNGPAPRANLTPKESKFVELYLGGMAASHAYRASGHTARTDRTAEVEGSRLLRRPEVANALAVARAAALMRHELTASRWLELVMQDRERAVASGQTGLSLKALELAGRSTIVAALRNTLDVNAKVRLEDLSTEQLVELLPEALKAIEKARKG